MIKRQGLFQRQIAKIIGEISVLRTTISNIFIHGSLNEQYSLDSSRVDYSLARALYYNTDDRYKLGAAFARPVINTTTGFMGVPHFSHENPDANTELETAFDKWSSRLIRINRNTLRDGDVFARIVRRKSRFDKHETFDIDLIPPEWVIPIPDPLNGGYMEIIIKMPVENKDENGEPRYLYTVIEKITPTSREITIDGDAPFDIKKRLEGTYENPWGFIPIVHFKNESEDYQLFGSSDLEPIEPFMKAYHDVMLFSVQGTKLFSRPKVKMKLQDIKKFIEDNFSREEIEKGKIKFDNKEIFLMQQGDDIEFITADQGLEGVTTLLKFLFFNIVDASETPEFAFGTAVQSSKASVSEQMVPLARKVRRKRAMFEEPYIELASMYLAMWAKVNRIKLDTYNVGIDWDEITPRDEQGIAQTIKTLVDGLATAVETRLISLESASEFLREFVPSMLPWLDADAQEDEQRRVAKSMAFLARVEDGFGFEELENEEGA
jgi:hypothetical protein